MANKLKWMLEVSGVDKAAQQLKDLDALASKVGVGKKGINLEDFMKASGGNMSEAFKKANPDFVKSLSQSTEKGAADGLKKALTNSQIQDLLSKWNSQALMKRTQEFVRNLNKWGDINENAPRAGVPAWKNLLAGLIGGASGNQYLGARALIAGAGVGGGSGGSGGLFGAGGAGGNFLPITLALAGLRIASNNLKVAFEEMMESIKRGAQLYRDAAKLGRNTNRVSGIQNALSALGLDPGMANTLLLNAQFPQGSYGRGRGLNQGSGGSSRGLYADIDGELLAARRGVGQAGELQMLINLEKEFKQSRLDTAEASKVLGETSKTLFQLQTQLNQVSIELRAVWANLATDLGTLLIPVLRGVDLLLEQINKHWQVIGSALLGAVGLNTLSAAVVLGAGRQPGGSPFAPVLGGGAGNPFSSTANQFQRMGFVFGGAPDVQKEQLGVLRQIERNTRINSGGGVNGPYGPFPLQGGASLDQFRAPYMNSDTPGIQGPFRNFP